ADRFEGEGPELERAPDLYRGEIDLPRVEAMLREALAAELDGVRGAVDGDVELREEGGDRADVVLVAVGEDDAAEAVAPSEDIVEGGVENMDAEVVRRKGDAAVDEHDAVVLLDREAVHADLPEAAEGDEAEGVRAGTGVLDVNVLQGEASSANRWRSIPVSPHAWG